jgi:hypothetical protein
VSAWTLRLQSGQPAYFQLGVGPKPIFLANRTFPKVVPVRSSDKFCHFAREPTLRCLGPDCLDPEE